MLNTHGNHCQSVSNIRSSRRPQHCPTLRFCPSKGSEPLTSVYRMTPRLQTSTSGPSYFFPCRVTELHYPAAHWFITTTHFTVLEEEEEKMKKKVYRNIINITYSITCTLVHYYGVALPAESIKLCLNMMSLPPF